MPYATDPYAMEEFESEQYEEETPEGGPSYGDQPPPGAPPPPSGPPTAGGPLNEEEEIDAAGELLNVTNEEELEQFLGDLVNTVAGAAKNFADSPAGSQLVGVLKGAASQALPMVGAAIGGRFGGPAGARIGSQLAQTAGQVFGLELEGLSPEDQEFELARRFVRFASSTTHHWARRGWSAWTAARHAARHHAPGLFGPHPGFRYRHGFGPRHGFGYPHPGYLEEAGSEEQFMPHFRFGRYGGVGGFGRWRGRYMSRTPGQWGSQSGGRWVWRHNRWVWRRE
ncbi:MAG TPA: hypothetical protein VK673_13215 [Chthoniobacterales bacterium]|nr:hypothetical protein [Chthoniobacterales bacterium]